MSNWVNILSFTKINLYMNIIVVMFLIIFLKPTEHEFNIQNKNYHTHCQKQVSKKLLIDLETHNEDVDNTDYNTNNTDHNHINKDTGIIFTGHSHELFDHKIKKPRLVENYNPKNIYESTYNRHLEYLLKGFVVIIVIISTVVMNKVLL